MAELSKQALKVQNNTEFPNNNAGLITPSKLRGFNTDMIDSLVDEISYNADSASWNSSISNINAFTASAAGLNTGSLLITASAAQNVITFTKGNGSTFNVTVADTTDLSPLNQATASLQAFTQSANVSINALNQSSASQQTQINSLIAATGSYVTAAITASSLITASFNNGTRNLTFTKGDSSTFSVNIPDVSGSSGNFVTTSSFNAYTQSNDARVTALEANTASVNTSITNINSATASLFTSASLSLTTASFNNGNRNLTFSKGDGTQFSVNIPDQSGSAGDFVTTASFNAYTQSNDQKVNSLISATGSYATTGSNTFTGNQTITTSGNTQLNIISTGGGQANVDFQAPNSNFRAYGLFQINNNGQYGGSGSIQLLAKDNNIIFAADGGFQLGQTNGVGNGIGAGAVTINVPTGSNTLQLTGSLNVLNSLSASLQQGYVWVGDASNRTALVATSSFGSTINTGSFATTGSNTFVGIQNFTNQITASNTLINGDLIANPNTSTKLNGNTDVSGFLYVGGGLTLNTPANITWLGSGSIGAGFSASVASQFAAISPTATGSLLVTASAAGADITFTKGDGSTFSVTVATGSVASASFAETASLATNALDIVVNVKNTTGAQINKGTVVRIIGATGDNPLIQTASWDNDSTSANTLGFVVTDIPNDTFGRVMTQGTLLSVNTDPALGYTAGQLVYLSSSGQFTNIQPPAPYHEVRLGQVLRAQQNNGSIYVLVQNGYELSELHDVNINTGSLANNNLLAYNSSTTQWENKTLTEVGGVTTASFNAITGAFATTGSNNFIGVETIGDVAGTGFGEVYLLGRSGSLIIGNSTSTPTYAALAHITSSQINANTSLIFKTNTNTGTTQLSGSANIFVNPAAPSAGYVRYIGGTNNLFLNGQGGNLPQITGSAASVSGNRPTMNSNFIAGPQFWNINQSVNPGTHTYSHNIINGTSTMNFNMLGNTGAVTFGQNILSSPNFTINSPSQSVANVLAGITGSNALTITSNLNLASQLTYNGPISSSTHQISQNLLPGFLTMNVQSGSRAYTVNSNVVQGFTINDNTVSAPNLGSTHIIGSNNIGNVTINNRASASINIQQNQLQGFTISNDYDSSTNGSVGKAFVLQGNNIIGFIGNNIYFSGSANGTGTANDRGRGLYGNVIGGSRISASVIGDGNKHLLASAIIGQGLNIYGTSLYDVSNAAIAGGQNGGSAFFGRWNAEDGNRANSSETVFVVGTGVSGSAGIVRKTGFLIDSGSNTFIEGTLNVSGSTSFTGSAPTILSSSFSGSVITNLTDVYTDVSAVNQIVTLTSASYAGLVSGSLTNPNTLYIVSGSTQVNPAFPYTGSASITGSLIITGSARGNVVALSISSNTASMDLAAGNYFTLTLADTATTHITATNIQPGTSATLVITTGTNSSASLAPTLLEPSGSEYVATNGSAKKDVLSFVSVDSTNLFVVSTKNMI